jgi:hypothetical protein
MGLPRFEGKEGVEWRGKYFIGKEIRKKEKSYW